MPSVPPPLPRPKGPPLRSKSQAASIEDQIRFAYYTPLYNSSSPSTPGFSDSRRLGRINEADGKPDKYDAIYGQMQGKAPPKLYPHKRQDSVSSQDLLDGPGSGPPGSGYDAPESASLPRGSKSRSCSNLPPPNIYNAAEPIQSREFTPVRQANSGDQIYGNGSRRGTEGSAGRSSRNSKHDSDYMTAEQLPQAFTSGIDVPPEQALEWRSGGFDKLVARARSEAKLRREKKNTENPTVQHARAVYPSLGIAQKRAARVFLPMSCRRSDPIPTYDGNDNLENLRRGKWQLKGIGQSIEEATASALLPLDAERLRNEAIQTLATKAQYRMELEGLSKKKQKFVLDELYGVMEENVHQRHSPSDSGWNPGDEDDQHQQLPEEGSAAIPGDALSSAGVSCDARGWPKSDSRPNS